MYPQRTEAFLFLESLDFAQVYFLVRAARSDDGFIGVEIDLLHGGGVALRDVDTCMYACMYVCMYVCVCGGMLYKPSDIYTHT